MTIPSGIPRVATLQMGRVGLYNINRTNAQMLRVQEELASGKSLTRVSDDAVRASIVGRLDDRIGRTDQILRNLSHASSSLGVLDTTLDEIANVAREAKSLATEQLNITSTTSERASQASVVEQMIRSLFNSANQEGVSGYIFGGSITSRAPVTSELGGYRYRGEGAGLFSDLGLAASVPLTLGDVEALAGTSSRIRGDVDLNPTLTLDTKIADTTGARSLPIERGSVQMAVNGSDALSVDLSRADTVDDVIRQLDAAIRQYERDSGTTILGPGGVSLSGNAISLDVGGTNSLTFSDAAAGFTAQDLGLDGVTFNASTPVGADLNAKLTWRTPVSALAGVSGTLGSFRLENAGRSAIIDLSAATTLDDVRNAIEGVQLGVRVRINSDGTGLDLVNEISSASARSMSVSEVTGGGQTATQLGLRSMNLSTRISDFNFGRGVQVVDNVTNPVTGLVDPALSSDLSIRLGNAAGTQISIDLRPSDLTDVQTLLSRMNAEIQAGLASAGLPASALTATLSSTTNGIALTQDPTFTGAIVVNPLNNSAAAEQLGLLDSAYDASSATFTGTDHAKVRVESLFTHLQDLREALLSNDTSGMGLAVSGIESTLGTLAETRGLVGSYTQRVESAQVREQDRKTVDESIRSELQDTDYTEASVRFSLLQTQLQAGLRVTSQASNLSLLDFLS
jgi:flagellin-like hook-associated protein FlgL